MRVFFFLSIVTLFLTQEGFAVTRKFDIAGFDKRSASGNTDYSAENEQKFQEFKTSDAYIQYERDSKSFYTIYREYFLSGELKVEGKLTRAGHESASAGVWTTYDKSGKIVSTTDFEKGYKIHFEEVLAICKKRKIDLFDRLSSLSRAKTGDAPKWYAEWASGEAGKDVAQNPVISGPTRKIRSIVIDGVTGVVSDGPSHDHLDN